MALRQEVVGTRRPWFVIAVALALLAQIATIVCVLEPRTTVRVVHTTSAEIITIPVPLPVEEVVRVPVERLACPPPRTEARFVPPASLPEPIENVRPSPSNAGWIAAWNARHIYISTDAGASWQRRLDGAERVQDVAFDCFGRAIALRGNVVGVRDGTAEVWRTVPQMRVPGPDAPNARLLGGGPDIVAIAAGGGDIDTPEVRLLVSHDAGVSWRGERLEAMWEHENLATHGRQHEDGTVLAMIPIPDCMHSNPHVFRWRQGKLERIDTELYADLAIFGSRMVASNGWQRIGGERQELPGPAYPTVIEGGTYPILIVDEAAWRLDANTLTRLPWKVGSFAYVADPAGRLWSAACGQPHVATRALPPSCPDQGAGDSR